VPHCFLYSIFYVSFAHLSLVFTFTFRHFSHFSFISPSSYLHLGPVGWSVGEKDY
jgi:hypothetical protein